jgi:hypothetical protein
MMQLARNERICIADTSLIGVIVIQNHGPGLVVLKSNDSRLELPPGQVRVLRIVGSIYLEAAKDRGSSVEFDFMPR